MVVPTLLLALYGLVGCTTDPRTYDADLDGTPDFDDCQPNDPTSFPGAVEVCDGLDNDCDTLVDDGISGVFYEDVDGDGHGDPNSKIESCKRPVTSVLIADDCDDTRADIYPGAPDVCDGYDNDCDGERDEPRWIEDFEAPLNDEVTRITGTAGVIPDGGDNFMRLVRSTGNQNGGFFLREQVPAGLWNLTFEFRMSSIGPTDGEGMTFTFFKEDTTDVLGGGGPDLGIYGAAVNGWAIEFDPFKNDIDDTNGSSRHIAVHSTDGARIVENTSVPTMIDGTWKGVQISMDGPILNLSMGGQNVFVDEALPIGVGDFLTVGFTASTSDTRFLQIGLDNIRMECPYIFVPGDSADTGSDSDTDTDVN